MALRINNHNTSNLKTKQTQEKSKNYEDVRLDEQLKWHSRKARQNKLRYRFYQITIMIISAIIPLVNLIEIPVIDTETRIISSILGAAILIITGLTQLEKYQENWIIYRTTAELLKKEKYFYENGVDEYSGLDDVAKRKLLVERVEHLISSETNKYFTIHKPHSKTGDK